MLKINKIIIILCAFLAPVIITHSAIALPSTTTISSSKPQISPIVPQNIIPTPPDFDVKAYILLDANSGYVIAQKNADAHLPPASLTKLMTLYLAANALKINRIHMDDSVVISEKAWRMGGSKMFIKVGSSVPVKELIDGIVIASGNDASVAIAEFIGGTEPTFVNLMNQAAAHLDMKNSHFADSNGLPEPMHYSSARDMGTLARAWILDFPEYYPWFKQQWIKFNNIKQPNRNRLLWRDSSVDGMKTGHTEEAGYCLVASAVRNGMRLITVVMGAPSDQARINDTEALLNYGFRFYETHKVYAASSPLLIQRIWLGKHKQTPFGVSRDLYVTTPIGQYTNVKTNVNMSTPLKAPIAKGQACGTLVVTANNKAIAQEPIVASADNPRGGMFSQAFDYIGLLFAHLF
jgi:serine-type D-Ala-D-Ala carboxypeptidase (penicillin-binding protein 5/6)